VAGQHRLFLDQNHIRRERRWRWGDQLCDRRQHDPGAAHRHDYHRWADVFGVAVGDRRHRPVITAVVNGASFLSGFASAAWTTVQGTNLSPVRRS
jgi:hypothetical protein